MTKIRRIERIVAITKLLVETPGKLFPLGYFCELFDLAKSTISEDLLTVKQAFDRFNLGVLETVAGASGGVRFIPQRSGEEQRRILLELAGRLAEPERIIPGGFIYMTDLLFSPHLMSAVGEIFMSNFVHLYPDYIMTVETKGIPLAFMTAKAFGVPLVIVRRGSRVTEGSAVSINYVTGSSKRIQTMSLPKRALPSGARVLVIDDFMKAGGTARGMVDLANEVGAEVVGMGVLVATAEPAEKLVKDYRALLVLNEVDQSAKRVDICPAL